MSVSARTTLTLEGFAAQVHAVHAGFFNLRNSHAVTGDAILRCTSCDEDTPVAPGRALYTSAKSRVVCPCRRTRTGPKQQTTADWQAKLDERFGPLVYTLLDEYESNSATRKSYCFRHAVCGQVFTTLLSSLLAPAGKASRCSCVQTKPRREASSHRTALAAAHGDQIQLIAWAGRGNNALHTYRHTVCGSTFARRAFHALGVEFCPVCHGENGNLRARHTCASIQPQLDEVHGTAEYTAVAVDHHTADYGVSTPTLFSVTLEHTCGHQFRASRNSFRAGTHLGRCPVCFGTSREARDVVYGGKRFRVLGYEERALQDLLRRYPVADIMSRGDGGFPKINYKYKSHRTYYPDFYISSSRTIVEVKSVGTAGLVDSGNKYFGHLWDQVRAKARKSLRDGYNFRLMLYIGDRNGLGLAQLPSNWLQLTKYQLAAELGIPIKKIRKKPGTEAPGFPSTLGFPTY